VVGYTTLVNGNSQLHLWNLNARKLQANLQAVHEGNLLSIADIVFSPNQQDVMAFTYDGGIFSYLHRWQIKTGKLQRSSPLSIDRTASLLALSPDGQTYVYGSDVIGYYIGNFQTKSWEFPQGLSPTSGLTRVVFSRDGQQMAIMSNDQTINVIH
jgi:WD40 repeat protein